MEGRRKERARVEAEARTEEAHRKVQMEECSKEPMEVQREAWREAGAGY